MYRDRKRTALLACILGSTVVGIDGSAIGVALPAIRTELGGGLAGQQWASNAYLLTLGSLLLLGGALGDAFGERRIFTFGLVGFGVTSLVCAAAPTIGILIAGRALQGASGALLIPAALAVIVSAFEADERSRAIGTWAAWSGIGAALGPLVGGQLVDAASWRWVFALNVPLVVVTVVLVRRAIPATCGARREPLDVIGALLCVAGLSGVTFGLIQQPLSGWGAPSVLVPLAAGAATFAGFIAYERRTPAPLLPVELFRQHNFVLGNVQTLVLYAGIALLFFYAVIYVQQVAGWSALEAGLSLVPVTIVMLVAASRFGALADRHGPRAFTVAGPLVTGLGSTAAVAPRPRRLLPRRAAARGHGVRAGAVDRRGAARPPSSWPMPTSETPARRPGSTTRSAGSRRCSASPASGWSSRPASRPSSTVAWIVAPLPRPRRPPSPTRRPTP